MERTRYTVDFEDGECRYAYGRTLSLAIADAGQTINAGIHSHAVILGDDYRLKATVYLGKDNRVHVEQQVVGEVA